MQVLGKSRGGQKKSENSRFLIAYFPFHGMLNWKIRTSYCSFFNLFFEQ